MGVLSELVRIHLLALLLGEALDEKFFAQALGHKQHQQGVPTRLSRARRFRHSLKSVVWPLRRMHAYVMKGAMISLDLKMRLSMICNWKPD